MFRMFRNSIVMQPLMSPEDAGGDSGAADEFEETINELIDGKGGDDDGDGDDGDETVGEGNVEDDIFNDGHLKPLKDDEDDGEETEEDDDKGNKKKVEDEETEDEVDDNKDDLIKTVKTKYPKLFKEHPELRAAFFRDKQFSEVFASPEDAREVIESVENFTEVQNEIASGKPDSIVQFLGKNNPKNLVKFGRSLIEAAFNGKQEIGAAIVFPSIAKILTNARQAAEQAGNKNLANSVAHLNTYLFGDDKLPEDTFRDEGNDGQGNEEVKRLIERTRNNFSEDVRVEGLRAFDGMINDSLTRLNAKPAVKKTIKIEIARGIINELNNDKAHMGRMRSLHIKAEKEGFTTNGKSRIKAAYLEGVKRILPRIRANVLKENGYEVKRVKKGSTVGKQDTENKGIRLIQDKSKQQKPGTPSARSKVAGMSDLDAMNALIDGK